MPTEGFTYDEERDLWMSGSYSDLGWADGSETYIGQVLANADRVSDYPIELARFIRDWPSRYHLSHLRVNLMESVRPLVDRSWKALEVGGGMGAITKWLAQAVASVDVIEGSLQRATVNRMRTRADRNVRIFVGDMTSARMSETYDLATLVGVLEYTPSGPGRSRRDSCLELLRWLRDSLTEEGVLMLAIENRLGTKYWAGCREDHSGRLFDGILGYPDDTPLTFSRNELGDLLSEAGFEHQQFYHVHPDYKLPETIIRETHGVGCPPLHQWLKGFAEDYSRPREYLAPDPLVAKSVEDAGLFWQFSNSFFVLCSPSQHARLAEGWLAKKYSNSARPELHHASTLVERDGVLRVERSPLRQGLAAVDLGEYRFALSDADHIAGSLLMTEAQKALISRDWLERLTRLGREVVEAAKSQYGTADGPQSDGYGLLTGSALDFTFWNLIRGDDGVLHFFDTKWTRATPVPADYLLFRSLYYLLRDAAPFAPDSFHKVMLRVMRQVFPTFTAARLRDHRKNERLLQQTIRPPLERGSRSRRFAGLLRPANWRLLSEPLRRSSQMGSWRLKMKRTIEILRWLYRESGPA